MDKSVNITSCWSGYFFFGAHRGEIKLNPLHGQYWQIMYGMEVDERGWIRCRCLGISVLSLTDSLWNNKIKSTSLKKIHFHQQIINQQLQKLIFVRCTNFLLSKRTFFFVDIFWVNQTQTVMCGTYSSSFD